MGYTRKQCEKLVLLADKDGRITFVKMRKAFPDCDDQFFYHWIGDEFVDNPPSVVLAERRGSIMLFWVDCPDDYRHDYHFKDNDLFELSVSASDLLYELQEKRRSKAITYFCAVCSFIAAVASVAALLR